MTPNPNDTWFNRLAELVALATAVFCIWTDDDLAAVHFLVFAVYLRIHRKLP